jgi:hypothetical protein
MSTDNKQSIDNEHEEITYLFRKLEGFVDSLTTENFLLREEIKSLEEKIDNNLISTSK